jgi:hypothetical protein
MLANQVVEIIVQSSKGCILLHAQFALMTNHVGCWQYDKHVHCGKLGAQAGQ